MLQRIQSVWLLLASACAFLTLKFSTYSGTNKKLIPTFLTSTETIPMMLAAISTGILCLVLIFLYSNRKLQLRFTILAIFLECILIWMYYHEIQTGFVDRGAISLSALLHPAILLFLVFAAKGILADEKLIKDSNRLR